MRLILSNFGRLTEHARSLMSPRFVHRRKRPTSEDFGKNALRMAQNHNPGQPLFPRVALRGEELSWGANEFVSHQSNQKQKDWPSKAASVHGQQLWHWSQHSFWSQQKQRHAVPVDRCRQCTMRHCQQYCTFDALWLPITEVAAKGTNSKIESTTFQQLTTLLHCPFTVWHTQGS